MYNLLYLVLFIYVDLSSKSILSFISLDELSQ